MAGRVPYSTLNAKRSQTRAKGQSARTRLRPVLAMLLRPKDMRCLTLWRIVKCASWPTSPSRGNCYQSGGVIVNYNTNTAGRGH